MLFLGNIKDAVSTNYPMEIVRLMMLNTILMSNCDDIAYLQLNQGIFDEVNLEVYDEETVNNDIDNYVFPEIWTKYTVLHADFNNSNLAAGDFDYMVDEVSSLIIKKRAVNSVNMYLPIFEKSIYANTNEFDFTFTDYLVRNGHEYEYVLVPILKNGIEGKSIPVVYEDDERKVYFEGIFICEPDSVYYTLLNLELTAQKNKPSSIITTIGRTYPYVLCGTENNYYTGTAKGLFVQYQNGDFNFDKAWDFREKFNEFLLDGKVKLLKYYDGRMWLVSIYDNVTNERDGHDNIIITGFNWCEIGNVDDVYSLYDNGFISYNPYTKSLSIEDEYDYSNIIYTAIIVDEKGQSVVNASVKLYGNDDNIISSTKTNTVGQFSFSKLKDGDYKISITCNGYISKFVNITVDNHIIIASNTIVITTVNTNITDDERPYSGITWNVLKVSNLKYDNRDIFYEGNEIEGNEITCNIVNNGVTNTEIILESDFNMSPNDYVYINMICTYAKDENAVQEDLDGCAANIRAVLYTGISDIESDYEYNYYEIINCSTGISFREQFTESSPSNSGYADSSGKLKLYLFVECPESRRDNIYSVVKSITINVNGRNLFEMR